MDFDFFLLIISIVAGTVASVSGFGIGSLITPFLALKLDTKVAIALVSIPHFIATALRLWLLRGHIDKKVLIHFGMLSAVGGLLGALLNSVFSPTALTLILGTILIFAGSMGAFGIVEKIRFGRRIAWAMGVLSGLLGGLVGNQGGIRSAALLGFNIQRESFVATATAIGVIVDTVRMPIYFSAGHPSILEQKDYLILATLGCIVGTFLGLSVLKRIPERKFKKIVSVLIFFLGCFMTYKGLE